MLNTSGVFILYPTEVKSLEQKVPWLVFTLFLFQLGKTKHREVKQFDEGHVINNGYDSGLLTPALSPDFNFLAPF